MVQLGEVRSSVAEAGKRVIYDLRSEPTAGCIPPRVPGRSQGIRKESVHRVEELPEGSLEHFA
jgi:hypothetical protein